MLHRKVDSSAQQQIAFEVAAQQAKQLEDMAKLQAKQQETLEKQQAKEQERVAKEQAKSDAARAKLTQDVLGTFAKSAARSLGGSTGQKIVRGLLGSLFGGR